MLLQEVKHKLVDNKMFDTAIGRYHNRCKVKNLYCEFAKLIKKYRRDSLQEDMTLPLSDYIFVCWWQGEADMSPMIRECYQRIKQFNTDKKVILITADNMNQWVQFPDYIITKFNEGKITKTHMSDLLRCALLRDWGVFGWILPSIPLRNSRKGAISFRFIPAEIRERNIQQTCHTIDGQVISLFLGVPTMFYFGI